MQKTLLLVDHLRRKPRDGEEVPLLWRTPRDGEEVLRVPPPGRLLVPTKASLGLLAVFCRRDSNRGDLDKVRAIRGRTNSNNSPRSASRATPTTTRRTLHSLC